MINISDLNLNYIEQEPLVPISECIEFTKSYINQTKIMAVVIGLMMIYIFILEYKEYKRRQAS